MRRFTCTVTETLCRKIIVEAENREDAEGTIRDAYQKEEIILDASDHVGTEFEVVEKDVLT